MSEVKRGKRRPFWRTPKRTWMMRSGGPFGGRLCTHIIVLGFMFLGAQRIVSGEGEGRGEEGQGLQGSFRGRFRLRLLQGRDRRSTVFLFEEETSSEGALWTRRLNGACILGLRCDRRQVILHRFGGRCSWFEEALVQWVQGKETG